MAEIRIVRVTDSWIVAWKPEGMHTAPLEPGEEDTLLSRVTALYPEVRSVSGLKPVEPGLVHRLDRETSGLVLVARTLEAFRFFREESDGFRLVKRYTAVSLDCRDAESGCVPGWPFTGTLHPESGGGGPGTIRTPGGSPVSGRTDFPGPGSVLRSSFRAYGPGRVRTAPVAGNKAAESVGNQYETVILLAEPFDLPGRPVQTVRFRLELRRGFRHQVRCHLAASGFPIAGDPLYLQPDLRALFSRMHLYADGLEFRDPVDGLVVRIDLPREPFLP